MSNPHPIAGHRPMGSVLRVRQAEPGEHDLQHSDGVDAALHDGVRLRGAARQGPAEDQHAAPAGRHYPYL